MTSMVTARPARRARFLAVSVVAAVLVGACSDDQPDDGATRRDTTTATTEVTTTTAPGAAPTPRATLREAVEALLTAEVAGDHDTSYRLLGDEARLDYPDVAEWAARRSELPATTGFEIEAADERSKVVAVVTHAPGLDPFIGLSPSRERQTWTGVREGDGWLLAGEPEVEFLLPPDEDATGVARSWAEAVQACDEGAAAELEAVEEVFASSVGAAELCESSGPVVTGEVEPLPTGPQAADLVAQYSTDVYGWATVVPVTDPVAPFFVVLAPIGDTWRVVALYD